MKTKYLKPAVIVSFASTLLVACGGSKSAALLPPPPMVTPTVAVSVQPTLMASAQPVAALPPGVTPAAPLPAVAPDPADGSVASKFGGKDETERLTWALRAYYDDSSRPAISTFEPMVAARLIKSVPVAPTGKKYVIDLKVCAVRLEDMK